MVAKRFMQGLLICVVWVGIDAVAGAGECTQAAREKFRASGKIRTPRGRAGDCGYLSPQGHHAATGGQQLMNDRATTVRVWDLPTRSFHWLLAGCVFASIGSAWIGGNAMVWHFRLGYAVFTLLAFRLVWGLVGGHWSRFASFAYAPATVVRYLRGSSRDDEHHEVGHNPLGAFSVFGVLALLAVQVATGLFADDEIANTGPLQPLVSGATSLALTKWHKGYGQWLIIALVVMHIAAILYYLTARRRNLIAPMLTGDKQLAVPAPHAIDNARSRTLAAALLAACALLVGWVVSLGG
jgi:cytochrome b